VSSNNSIRLLAIGIVAVMLASASGAQKASAVNSVSSEEVGSATIPPAPAQFAIMAEPRAPKVTCDKNQLAIAADNSTLGDVLAAVHSCIGVKVDIPEGATGRRVFENLGPGPARDVLESLLSGTEFNFAIGLSTSDPQKVDSVFLLLRSTDKIDNIEAANTDRALTPARRAWLQSRQNGRPAANFSDDTTQAAVESSDYTHTDDVAPTPASNTAPPASDTPVAPTDNTVLSPAPIAPIAATASDPSPVVNPDKSTAERIAEMQQMFVQRRQMNQTQNQSSTPASTQP